MNKFLVMGLFNGKLIVKGAFDTELEAWTYIGELEHEECLARPELTCREASKVIQSQYRIFKPVC